MSHVFRSCSMSVQNRSNFGQICENFGRLRPTSSRSRSSVAQGGTTNIGAERAEYRPWAIPMLGELQLITLRPWRIPIMDMLQGSPRDTPNIGCATPGAAEKMASETGPSLAGSIARPSHQHNIDQKGHHDSSCQLRWFDPPMGMIRQWEWSASSRQAIGMCRRFKVPGLAGKGSEPSSRH